MPSSVDLPQPDGPSDGDELLRLDREAHVVERRHVPPSAVAIRLRPRSMMTRTRAPPQAKALDLAGRGLRQLGHEVDQRGTL